MWLPAVGCWAAVFLCWLADKVTTVVVIVDGGQEGSEDMQSMKLFCLLRTIYIQEAVVCVQREKADDTINGSLKAQTQLWGALFSVVMGHLFDFKAVC